MTADTGELIAAASRCIRAAFRPGFRLVKCGMMLDNLVPVEDAPSPRAAAAMDRLNARFGRNTVFMAAVGTARGWKLRTEHRSPCYTTRLADVPAVRALKTDGCSGVTAPCGPQLKEHR